MKKESWSTRIGVILAVMGSAVGLGNFLRFPGKAAQYEGGAFMVPYFIALFLLGLPIAWAEWAMGRHGGAKGFNSIPGIFRAIWKSKAAPYLGALGLLIPVAIYMYYVYIEAWCLGYAWKMAIGDLSMEVTDKAAYGKIFDDYVGMNADGGALHFAGNFFGSAFFFLIICFSLNFFLIYRGLSKGIEWFCKWAMPALVICALVVLVRVLTLGTPNPEKPDQNVLNGLGYMWNPVVDPALTANDDAALNDLIKTYMEAQGAAALSGKEVAEGKWTAGDRAAWDAAADKTGWVAHGERYGHDKSRLRITIDAQGHVALHPKTFLESLMKGQMWLEAAGQIFFSLSVGFGIICCYASYLKPNDDIALSSLTASAGNEFCEVALGGLITVPAAFVFLGAAGAVGGTFGLGFNTLPLVFNEMPGGRVVGTLFFILLFLAAVTSSLSMLQPAIALFEEGLGLGRKASVALLGFITAIGSLFVVYFSKGLTALDTIDFWVGSVGIYVLATIEVILFAWVMGAEKGHEELNRGASIPIPRWVTLMIKYVSPVFLVAVFAVWVYQNAGSYLKSITENPVVGMSIGLIVLLTVLFIFLIARSVQRWQQREDRHRCPQCQYDLAGSTSATCPECGAALPPDAVRTVPTEAAP